MFLSIYAHYLIINVLRLAREHFFIYNFFFWDSFHFCGHDCGSRNCCYHSRYSSRYISPRSSLQRHTSNLCTKLKRKSKKTIMEINKKKNKILQPMRVKGANIYYFCHQTIYWQCKRGLFTLEICGKIRCLLKKRKLIFSSLSRTST